ncbi:MAG: hypothetical protein ACFCUU_09765 [Cyclobacteriaceae bacterium]
MSTFTYGSVCDSPQNPVATLTGAEAVRISWEQGQAHTGYVMHKIDGNLKSDYQNLE